MDYIVDTLTKAPSQVLVKSASTFGEEAAKIIGGYIDESAKNVSDDVCTAVRDGASELSSTLKGSLSGFMDKFKETGVEAFTEWGICIERAFIHLGQKLEVGVSNAGTRFGTGLQNAAVDIAEKLDNTIRDAGHAAATEIKDFGLKHAEHYKNVFAEEINVLKTGFMMVCSGILLACVAFALQAGILGWITREFKTFAFVLFAIINGYVIYTWNKRMDNTATKQIEKPQLLFIIVAGIGFLAGNICREALYFSSLNLIFSISLMTVVTLVVFKALDMNVLFKGYTFVKSIQEFLEWKKQQQQQGNVQQASVTLQQTTTTSVTATITSNKDVAIGNDEQQVKLSPATPLDVADKQEEDMSTDDDEDEEGKKYLEPLSPELMKQLQQDNALEENNATIDNTNDDQQQPLASS